MAEVDNMTARVEILEIAQTGGNWAWQTARTVWAAAKPSDRKTYLSAIAVGTRAAEFAFRPAAAPGMDNAVRWRGTVYYPALLARDDRSLYTYMTGGEVEPMTATVTPYGQSAGYTVPAVLLERYLRATDETPMTEMEEAYILTLPKAVQLESADLVDLPQMGTFEVRTCHRLDPHRNYYEIRRISER